MPKQKILIIALLSCGIFGLCYWFGLENARRSKSQFTSVPAQTPENQPAISLTQSSSAVVVPMPQRQQPLPNIQPRDPVAKSNLINLSSWYNVSLQDDWPEAGRGKGWASLPSGLQTFAGTEFDVRGLIQLSAVNPATATYPARVEGIRVGMRCSKLHFLHNVIDAGRLVRPGTPLGAYVLHYSDGETFGVPIRLAANILDWWGSPAQLPEGGPAVLAWEGNLGARRRIILTKFTLENPRPEAEVTTIDFVADGQTKAAPFLMAITAEQ